MSSLFDTLVVTTLPFVPRPIVRKIASRYVAGATLQDAIDTVRRLAGEGANSTLDVLGESVTRAEETHATRDEYLRALDAVHASGLPCNISIKPTAIGLAIDEALARENGAAICRKARELGIFVRIDMEDTPYTDATIRLALDLHGEFGNVGTVLQAYLRRSLADLDGLGAAKMNLRICKGIYVEARRLAWKGRETIIRNYEALIAKHLGNGCYTGIATHDEACVQAALTVIDRLKLGPDRYEFQMLLGVDPLLRRILIDAGHRLRVYVPYGKDWYAYSVRRLKENPGLARHTVNEMLGRGPSAT